MAGISASNPQPMNPDLDVEAKEEQPPAAVVLLVAGVLAVGHEEVVEIGVGMMDLLHLEEALLPARMVRVATEGTIPLMLVGVPVMPIKVD
jgi:hypothetical protein